MVFRSVDILGPAGGFDGTNQSATPAAAAAPSGGGGSFWDSEPAPAPQAQATFDAFADFNSVPASQPAPTPTQPTADLFSSMSTTPVSAPQTSAPPPGTLSFL